MISSYIYYHFRDIKKRLIDTQQAQQTRQREEVKLDQAAPSKVNGSGGCC
jgi:Ras-related protein Rab-8A